VRGGFCGIEYLSGDQRHDGSGKGEAVSGDLTSIAIIVICVAGVVMAAKARRSDLGMSWEDYWSRGRVAIVAACCLGLVVLIVAQAVFARLGPPP
jgi:hypothetical protein